MIVKEGNMWVVKSHTSKNMGKYKSKKAAQLRLRQVEYFKRIK